MSFLSGLSNEIRQYIIVTANYWSFTLTDGALRMLVVLHFHQLGFSALEIATLFLFYEVFGVITNLIGGWLAARFGLNTTMNVGLALQVLALSMLLVPSSMLTVIWVMSAQALSGIAKDLNKMSAKSAIKMLVADNQQKTLFKWVALLTGSKNALKGVGFFLGGGLLAWLGFHDAILLIAWLLACVWLLSLTLLQADFGKSPHKPKFTHVFSKSSAVNTLSAARLFLFGARDVWFVVALPVYLSTTLDWAHESIGAFFATWIIGYGFIQAQAPKLIGKLPTGRPALFWVVTLTLLTFVLAVTVISPFNNEKFLIGGLFVFGAVFAVNSALHSYLIVSYADVSNVSMDVGFYYMANAIGRLIGTVLSGVLFQAYGLASCLFMAVAFLLTSSFFSIKLPASKKQFTR